MKQKDEQKELEKLLNNAAEAVDKNVPGSGEVPELESEPGFEIDYDKIQKKCNKQAKTLLKNATGFMLGDELVKTNSYIQSKLKTDIISLGGMLYQVEVLLTMQRALTEEIRHGDTQPRMFEVFSGLSKIISENNKQLLQTVEAIKMTYLDLKDNILTMNDERPLGLEGGLVKTEEGTLSLGSRELIKNSVERKRLKLTEKTDDPDAFEDVEEIK